jgi:hypothetical protein
MFAGAAAVVTPFIAALLVLHVALSASTPA